METAIVKAAENKYDMMVLLLHTASAEGIATASECQNIVEWRFIFVVMTTKPFLFWNSAEMLMLIILIEELEGESEGERGREAGGREGGRENSSRTIF